MAADKYHVDANIDASSKSHASFSVADTIMLMGSRDSFRVNDIVLCKIHEGFIVPRLESIYDDKISFKIIGAKLNVWDTDEFIIYVPEYELTRIKTNLHVGNYTSKEFGIDPKFLGEHMTFIRETHIVQVEWRADGEWCNRCREYFAWAEAQDDSGFTCAACRQNPWR